MKLITLCSLASLALLAGCAEKVKPLAIYQEPSGENTAKLRVVGFTANTYVNTNHTCTREEWRTGYIRDVNTPQGQNNIRDKGFIKTDLKDQGYPLDYAEINISSEGVSYVSSTFYTSSNTFCMVQTGWFKAQKGTFYEIRNKLSDNGKSCTMQLFVVDQQNGNVTPQALSRQPIETLQQCR